MEFETYKSKDGYRWRLLDYDGEAIEESVKAYTRQWSCNRALKREMERHALLVQADASQLRTLIDSFLRYGLEEELEDQILTGNSVMLAR